MNVQEIKEALISGAQEKGICGPGYDRMLASDIDGLVDYYVANPDWCLERGFPALGFLRAHFTDRADKGVFVDRTFRGELLNERQAYIFHNCKGTIKVGLNVGKGIIPMLYLANGCRLHIVGAGDAKPGKPSVVPVYTFGKNDVSARDNRYVKFSRYKSGLI